MKLARWGNSLAVRIPSPIADEAELREGASVDIAAVPDGGLRIVPLRETPTLEDLVQQMTDENRHGECDWGHSVGNEGW